MQQSLLYPPLDLKKTISSNRLVGLWGLMKGFRLTYFGAVASLAVATIAKALTYLLLAYFVDDILNQAQPTVPFFLIALGFVGLAVFQGGFTFISGKLAARSAEGVILRLRNYLFDHIQRLPFTYHDHTQTGELIQRCTSDVDAVRRFFAEQAIEVGRVLMLFTINFAALLSINTRLAWLSILSFPLAFIYSSLVARRIHTVYESHQEQEGVLSATLQENLTGIRVVKAFARQQFEIDKFEQANFELYQRGRRLVKLFATYWPVLETISGLQMVLIFFLGALMVIEGTMTIGDYLAFAGLVIWIIWPLQGLGRLITQTSTGLVSYNRLVDIIRESREEERDEEVESRRAEEQGSGGVIMVTQNALDQATPVSPEDSVLSTLRRPATSNGTNGKTSFTIRGEIVFKNVSFEYDTNTPVLHDISFAAKPGQMVALLGPTGSGKSSLVNLLPRFYDYTGGQILLDGLELSHYPLPELRRQVGIVEQEPFLFSRTLRENIAYGVRREVPQAEIEAAARAAAIHDIILTFPDGYDTLVGEKGVTLSGGQKQRMAIARTLLKDPRILVFDDAVSAVDTETEAIIHTALERLRQGRTTFVIAHRIQTVMRADLILVLDQGQIVQRGRHHELMAQEGIYWRIYELQSSIEQEIETANTRPGTDGQVRE
jgi:ATP-binding cassette subfamily B protein